MVKSSTAGYRGGEHQMYITPNVYSVLFCIPVLIHTSLANK